MAEGGGGAELTRGMGCKRAFGGGGVAVEAVGFESPFGRWCQYMGR